MGLYTVGYECTGENCGLAFEISYPDEPTGKEDVRCPLCQSEAQPVQWDSDLDHIFEPTETEEST
jgi:peptide subunit release factor 1 (eRF1)